MSTKFVILCGGQGTRLWPISNSKIPKQFVVMNEQKSLLDRSIERISSLSLDHPLIVSNRKYDIDKYENILYEDYSNDTAVAVLRSVLEVERKYGNVKVVVLPADHNIENNDIFIKDIQRGIDKVNDHNIVLFGISPEYPSSKYGYILPQQSEIKFKEKPNTSDAMKLIDQGALWNSGIFAANTRTILNAIENSTHDIFEWINQPREGNAPSFDVAVLQEYSHISLVRCHDWGWSDIGSHDSFLLLPEIKQEVDAGKNVVKMLSEDVSVLNRGRGNVVVIGCDDLRIIVNGDDILITKNGDYSDELKQLISKNIIT